ncbi:MAG: ArnT family glycosyltransferase [Planctomycetota bacterium]
MMLVLVLAAGLLAKQILCARIAVVDATQYYLPLAWAQMEGCPVDAQHPGIPPLYPIAVGELAKIVRRADDPAEVAGRLLSAGAALGLVVCVYFLAREFGNRRVALTAAGLTAVSRQITHVGAAVGPDMTYALLLAVFCLLLLRLARHWRWYLPVAMGVMAGLAALVRSEGMFLIPLAVLAALVLPWRPAARRLVRRAGVAGLTLLVVATIWWPRVAYVHSETGLYALDVRMYTLGPWKQDVDDRHTTPRSYVAAAPPERQKHHDLAYRAEETFENLLRVVGYVTWPLIIAYLVAGRRLFAVGRRQWLLLGVLVVELGIVAQVSLPKRYVTLVAGPAQVWGGLGAVALMERLRRWRPRLVTVGRELAGLALMLGGLSCLSLFSTSQGTRHSEMRALGTVARQRYGAGQVILSPRAEPIYYARGFRIKAPYPETPEQMGGQAKLRRLCREYDVDLIVTERDDPWNRWLGEQIAADALPGGAVVHAAEYDGSVSYLIDARALFDDVSDGQGGGARAEGQP